MLTPKRFSVADRFGRILAFIMEAQKSQAACELEQISRELIEVRLELLPG